MRLSDWNELSEKKEPGSELMPRVHKQVARKDYEREGIKKGDVYYKWTLRPGGFGKGTLYRSTTPPKPWQLTSSPFLQELYMLEDRVSNLEDLSDIEELISEIRSLGEEEESKLYNMPDSLQSSPTGELLQERYDACEEWASELESIEIPEDDASEEYREAALDEARNCLYPG